MNILDQAAQVLRRSGFFISRAEKTICFFGREVADFEGATELMKDVRRALKPNKLLLSSPNSETCRWLRSRFPGSVVVPPPWNSRRLARRYFRCLDPVIFFWIGLDQCLPVKLLEQARRLGIPVVAVGAGMKGSSRFNSKAISQVDRFLVPNHTEAAKIEAMGGSGIVNCGGIAKAPSSGDRLTTNQGGIGDILDRLPRRELHSKKKSRFLLNLSHRRPGKWMASRLGGRRIECWDALRDRLGRPHTILCLGNGPSSEDPAVLEVGHDCLMRVNHRWISRGVLTNPDMVFVGSLSTTLRVPPCVFGFRTIFREREILLRHLLLGLRLQPLEYFTLERASADAYSHTTWSAHPTNGAIMIATAARLQPNRIVISGMDLFEDPRGRYPGETASENEYFQSHDRNVDLAVIDEALSAFEGSVEILSPRLSLALRELRSRAADNHQVPSTF